MGTSHSKHRSSASKTGTEGSRSVELTGTEQRWSDMEGPNFYCAYMGFVPLSKPPTGVSVLQSPVKDLYFKYRRSSSGARSASLKLTQHGVVVALFEDGRVKAELFFDFSSVTYVEALKFSPVKTSSERKPKAMFVPVDEGKGPVPEKHAFLLDKHFHFLVSSSHPPLVVCVVRRPQGVKALDCHVFALDTAENALHIAALVGSTQIPAGLHGEPVGGEVSRGRGSFDRKSRGDVIRTEYGEYSVYRGQGQGSNYEPLASPTGQQPQFFPGPAVGAGPSRNGQSPVGVVPGGVMLTQDDFHRPQQIPATQHNKAPYLQDGGGQTFVYEQQVMGQRSEQAMGQRPDILHGRQRSGDSTDDYSGLLNRSFGGGGGVGLRHEDG
ncbi:uncharacterized protein LOC106014168, partial [Aplysia californica]|uniref:Uncharacterized protein LOC106014168 n=1 Tax=Aplysia californica TaxID=6500 RepID=A0ABM1AFM0_APLCA